MSRITQHPFVPGEYGSRSCSSCGRREADNVHCWEYDEFPGAEIYVEQHRGWRNDAIADGRFTADEFKRELVKLYLDEYNDSPQQVSKNTMAIIDYCEANNL